ncbi:MAG: hypothetical protein K940chlam7_01469 [Chlamydiae bacterium]|nr:hypothetical protein [Chlamydiota bacterium]
MFIQKSLATFSHFYTSWIDGDQETQTVVSHDNSDESVKIPIETLATAVLDNQSDGALRLMTLNRCGSSEVRIFADEERLNHYLSQDERVDIWEIEDRREQTPKILYKYEVWDEENSFSTQEELYKEISYGTEHGVFCLQNHNTQEKRYIQQKKGWFQRGFEEVTAVQAQQTLTAREAGNLRRRRVYIIGIAALAAAPVMVDLGKTLTKSWETLRTTTEGLVPSYPLASLQKTTTLVSGLLLAQGMHTISGRPGGHLALPALLGGLASFGYAEAQSYANGVGSNKMKKIEALPYCLTQIGSSSNFSGAREVALSGKYAFVVDYPTRVQIIDVSNESNPVRVSWIDTPGGLASGVALQDNNAFTVHEGSGLLITNVTDKSNPIDLGIGDTAGYAYRVAVSGNYAYVADYFGGFSVFDVSDKKNPRRTQWTQPIPAGNDIQEVALHDNSVYFVDRSHGYLWIYDVTTPPGASYTGLYNSSLGHPWDVIVRDNYAYMASSGGLEIVDVSNKSNPMFSGWFDTNAIGGSDSRGVCFWNDYVVIGNTAGIYIFDVSNKSAPILVGSDNTGGGWGIATLGNTIFAPYFQFGLRVIAIRNCTDTSSSSATSTSTSMSSSTTTSSNTTSTIILFRSTIPGNIPTTPPASFKQSFFVWVGLGIGVAGVVCLGASGTTLFYWVKRRNSLADELTITHSKETPLELRPKESEHQKTPAHVTQEHEYGLTPDVVTHESEYKKASDVLSYEGEYKKTPDHVSYEDAYRKTPDVVTNKPDTR